MAQQESPAFKQLKDQLREMFQLDRGDLDFGIYRIMNQKRGEVTKFLDDQLLPQVREILEEYQPASASTTQDELNKLLASLNDAGVDPETSPKVKELRAKLGQSVDINKLENEIYSDLYNFFKRYYSEGDFMSMRRYKEGVYALPYEGEEVKLHWANHDQYYIKTSEDLKNYSFKTVGGKKRVRFEVVAGGTETNNNKAAEGKERRFILHADAPVQANGDELIIRFEYRPDDAKRKQDDLNKETLDQILNLAEATAFGLKDKAASEKNADRTLLEKHLTEYTAKNSFDYFIHKDLGKFLRQELDFFIKNEIIHLDDIENETAPKVETYLAKVKAMRKVAGKIIQFLAQLEDFQKKLWLKKKFVLETHYCVTLDHIIGSDVADELLPIIAANDAQREEWVKLFAIDELKGDLTSVAYSNPLTVNFLKANDKLLVDTKFFDANFKYALLSIFDNIDEQTDGLLINSENFQALNLLQERYKKKVKCVYIDPPYNTGDDGFVYKDSYKSSSWLSLLSDRIRIGTQLLNPEGNFFASIDDREFSSLSYLLSEQLSKPKVIAVKMSEASGLKMSSVKSQGLIPKYKEYLLASNKLANKGYFFENIQKDEWDDEYNKFIDYYEKNIHDAIFENSENVNEDRLIEINELLKPAKLVGIKSAYDKHNNKNISFEDWRLENSWRIIRTAASTSVFKLAKEKRIKQNVFGVISSRDKILYLVDGSFDETSKAPRVQILFASDNLSIHPGDFWADISTTGLEAEGEIEFKNGKKPLKLLKRLFHHNLSNNHYLLDFFAGSGSSGNAVIDLNAELSRRSKYIQVDMGEYFSEKLQPRISLAVKRNNISQIVKYMALEQYEDALDNLGLSKSETQAALLASNPTLNEQYMLGYMLDVESRGSQSLLNIDAFADPFAYTLRITRNDDTQVVNVDLIETFNYLLGVTVRTVDRDKSGIVTVTGKNSLGENCLIIWRNVNDIDNAKLDAWFGKRYSSKDFEFDAIYVNGDNNIENMKLADDHWKVRLIEAEFKRLMFDVQDV